MQKKAFSGKVILTPTDQKQLAQFFSLLIQIDKRISAKKIKKQKMKRQWLESHYIAEFFIARPYFAEATKGSTAIHPG